MIIIVGDVAVTVKDGVSQLTWIQRYKPIKLQHYKYLSNTILLSKKTKQIQHVSLLQEVFDTKYNMKFCMKILAYLTDQVQFKEHSSNKNSKEDFRLSII